MSILGNNLRKVIGIMGGMGPRAGLTLHQKLIDNLKIKQDQDHLPIIHTSFSSIITDRTNYILGKDIESPSIGASKCINIIDNSLLNYDIDEIIIGIPCNTFHSKPILDPFLFYLNNIPKNNFKFLDMIELTINYIKNNYDNQKIGLLSTYGTISSNVYLNEAKKNDIELIYLDPKFYNDLNEAIYNKEWGLKKKSYPFNHKANEIIINCINEYNKIGVNNIILGCTELPLAINDLTCDNINLIDPVDILSKHMIFNYYLDKDTILL